MRAAVQDGLIRRPPELAWADVVALRAFIPAQTMVLTGEAAPRNLSRETTARSRGAIEAVKYALERDELGPEAVLAVRRRGASVYASVENAIADTATHLRAEGALLLLPAGDWWTEVRWRAGR